MKIKRLLEATLKKNWKDKKALIVLGPRQTGKTTLLMDLCERFGKFLFLNCDDPETKIKLENVNENKLKQLIGNNKIIFVDEAQRVKNIGLTLKIITDRIKHAKLVVSGSSSLELANEINEPLTGRKWEYTLFPISWNELLNHFGYFETSKQLEIRLIYGMYPEVVSHPGKEKDILLQLSSSYLYKDLLAYKGVRKAELIEKLLRALALQVGNEVSYNELSRLLEVDKETVMNYIWLLEQAFVIYRLSPLSRNLRSEINTSRKIYFYDTGIRNALISDFRPLALRKDVGALWENFIINERIKHTAYNQLYCNRYFWRTHAQQEIDYVEEREGKLFAFEFKWSNKTKAKFPKTFLKAYPGSETKLVTPGNFEEFLLNEKD